MQPAAKVFTPAGHLRLCLSRHGQPVMSRNANLQTPGRNLFRPAPPASYTATHRAAMPIVICLLRGVNVGLGKAGMAELRALCRSLDLENATTLLQSGNLVFSTKERSLPALTKRLETAFAKAFGFPSEMILRTPQELRQTIARNPFARRTGIEPAKLGVSFLAGEPTSGAGEELLKFGGLPEELHLIGRELFVYFPEGMGRSKLPWSKLDKVLGSPGTMRNWNTVQKLLTMAEEHEALAQ
jgi:uncharacterized protein (DUF1697 family)